MKIKKRARNLPLAEGMDGLQAEPLFKRQGGKNLWWTVLSNLHQTEGNFALRDSTNILEREFVFNTLIESRPK